MKWLPKAPRWPPNGPKTAQRGPKTAPKRLQDGLGTVSVAQEMPFSRPAEPALSLGGLAEEGAEHSAKQAAVPETPLQHGVRRHSRSVLQSTALLWGAWRDGITFDIQKSESHPIN